MTEQGKSVRCPFCAELIQEEALKCRYCGEWIVKQNKTPPSNKRVSKLRKLFYILPLLFFVFIAFTLTKPKLSNTEPKLSNTDYSADEAGLTKAADDIKSLHVLGEEGVRRIYRDYLHPNDKTISEDEHYQKFLEFKKEIPYEKIERHSVVVDGNMGYIDLTQYICTDSSCKNFSDPYRAYRKYEYVNGRWYVYNGVVSCPREKPYDMPPEFSRALSLMHQRYTEAIDHPDMEELFTEILKCVDIEYANEESEMAGAEGLFSFIPGQSPERLSILVSPRYKTQDDIVTATLLMHEFIHAMNYVSYYGLGETIDCFEDEARAFEHQYWLITKLNPEEKRSIIARLNSESSTEFLNMVTTWETIIGTKGANNFEKSLNYVKSQPYYQEQCSGR